MLLRKIPKRSIVMYPGELRDIASLIRSGSIIQGTFIEQFENGFKEYINTKEVIAVSSGRCAMSLILKNIGLKKGDGIILSAYNFSGVPKALLKDDFCLQFVDAHIDTYQIDASKIEERIDSNTKAIIATHLFGQPCNLDKIQQIARKYNLLVIEDAAHSLGSYYRGRHTGTIGDAGFFSFTGSKTLNTSFGGIAVTNDAVLARKIRNEITDYEYPRKKELIKEIAKRYIYIALTNRVFYTLTQYPITLLMSLVGSDPLEVYKSLKKTEVTEKYMKFTNLQALIGIKQIPFVKKLIKQRKDIAGLLIQNLSPLVHSQKNFPRSEPNYFMFPIRTKNKQKAYKNLLLQGVDSNLNYANDCSWMSKQANAPVAQSLADSILTIQLPFKLSNKNINHLVCSVNNIKKLLY